MREQADHRARAKLIGTAIGAVLGVVVAFYFGFVEPATRRVPVGSAPADPFSWSFTQPIYETVNDGYDYHDLLTVAFIAFIGSTVGWYVGNEVATQLSS